MLKICELPAATTCPYDGTAELDTSTTSVTLATQGNYSVSARYWNNRVNVSADDVVEVICCFICFNFPTEIQIRVVLGIANLALHTTSIDMPNGTTITTIPTDDTCGTYVARDTGAVNNMLLNVTAGQVAEWNVYSQMVCLYKSILN